MRAGLTCPGFERDVARHASAIPGDPFGSSPRLSCPFGCKIGTGLGGHEKLLGATKPTLNLGDAAPCDTDSALSPLSAGRSGLGALRRTGCLGDFLQGPLVRMRGGPDADETAQPTEKTGQSLGGQVIEVDERRSASCLRIVYAIPVRHLVLVASETTDRGEIFKLSVEAALAHRSVVPLYIDQEIGGRLADPAIHMTQDGLAEHE